MIEVAKYIWFGEGGLVPRTFLYFILRVPWTSISLSVSFSLSATIVSAKSYAFNQIRYL